SDGNSVFCCGLRYDYDINVTLARFGWSSPSFLLLSPDEKTLAAEDSIDGIRFWDAKTGDETHHLEACRLVLTCAAYQRDGKQICTGAADDLVRCWDAKTGKSLDKPERIAPAYSVAVSPDGKSVASSHEDGKLHVWDAARLKPQQTLTGTDKRGSHLAWV